MELGKVKCTFVSVMKVVYITVGVVSGNSGPMPFGKLMSTSDCFCLFVWSFVCLSVSSYIMIHQTSTD